jgi:hypothetical protein
VLESILIDNDTQDIYVNGKKWEKSPESYMHLRDSGLRQKVLFNHQLEAKEHTGIKMYRAVQAM